MPVTTVHANGPQVHLQLGPVEAGNSAAVHLHGATVLSWKSLGEEHLFLSDKAVLDGSKGIRGGIPLVFPQFGTAAPGHPYAQLPQHGFARNVRWWQEKVVCDDDKSVAVQFDMSQNDLSAEQRRTFPYTFRLSYLVSLNKVPSQGGGVGDACNLTTRLTVWNGEKSLNDDGHAIDVQALLHTYLRVPRAGDAAVAGLDGRDYYDKPTNSQQRQTQPLIQFNGDDDGAEEVDRVFADVPVHDRSVRLLLLGKQGEHDELHAGRMVAVQRDAASDDVVVWRPSHAKAAALGDMQTGGERHFVCVEVGHVRDYHRLLPGQEWVVSQTLSAMNASAAAL